MIYKRIKSVIAFIKLILKRETKGPVFGDIFDSTEQQYKKEVLKKFLNNFLQKYDSDEYRFFILDKCGPQRCYGNEKIFKANKLPIRHGKLVLVDKDKDSIFFDLVNMLEGLKFKRRKVNKRSLTPLRFNVNQSETFGSPRDNTRF